MNKIIIILTLGSLLCLSTACKEDSNNAKTVTKAIPSFKEEGQLALLNAAGDTIKTLTIEIADDSYQRQTGLMYRKKMATAQGMLFIFPDEKPRSFYMKNTHIPLDIIYINSDKKIVSIQKNAKILNEDALPSNVPAQYVLEINAGLSDAWGLSKGTAMAWKLD